MERGSGVVEEVGSEGSELVGREETGDDVDGVFVMGEEGTD